MNKSVLIIKGFSKTDDELINDRKIIQLYIDFFTSNAGGCFDLDKEIFILEDPELVQINELNFLNRQDYLIVVLVGHGATKDGKQVFQLNQNTIILPGQIQFKCERQLHIIESCREIIDFHIDIQRLNKLTPKYKYGGFVQKTLTREESSFIFNYALSTSNKGVIFLFACDINEKAYRYFFLQFLIDISIEFHEYSRRNVFGVSSIFEKVKNEVNKRSNGIQNPVKMGETDFPFVVTII